MSKKKPNEQKYDNIDIKSVKTGSTEDNIINMDEIASISDSIQNSENIIDDIVELMPTVELIIETISSLVVSPNNMTDIVINHEFENIDLPPEVRNTLTDTTKIYVNNNYNIDKKIIKIVKESLYYKGSYVELNIPPVIINDLLSKVKGNRIVGSVASVTHNIEKSDGFITNENHDGLKISDSLYSLIINDNIVTPTTASFESRYYKGFSNLQNNNSDVVAGLNSNKIEKAIYTIDNKLLSKNNGKPIILKIPSKYIIPIASKDDPSKHYGYFYINKDNLNIKDISSYSDDKLSTIYKDIKKVMENSKDNIPTISNMEELKNSVIINKLKNFQKVDNKDINIELDDSLVITIAESIIKKSDIEFIYLPEELVSFYAINYRPNGTGKSLLEKIAVLASIKNILLFTNLLAVVKSNITTTEIKIDLDENDVNYRATIKKILKHVMENRKFSLPIRMLKVDNFVKWSHELGYTVKANHPQIPDTDIEVTEVMNDIKPIDTDLFETIDNDIITGLYGIPDMMNNINDNDFAITVRQKYLMLDKRIRGLQDEYNNLLTKDINKKLFLDKVYIDTVKTIIRSNLSIIKKYVRHNNTIVGNIELKEIIKDKNKDEYLIELYTYYLIKEHTTTLQKPINKNDETTIEDFTNYTDTIDEVIDKLLSSDAIPAEIIGEISDNLDNVKAALKVMLIKDYMSKNNILPEFINMFTLNEYGEPNTLLLDGFSNHIDVLSKIALQFVKENKDDVTDINKKLEKIDDDDLDNKPDDSTPVNKDKNEPDDNVPDDVNKDKEIEDSGDTLNEIPNELPDNGEVE